MAKGSLALVSVFGSLMGMCLGHGALTFPRPRNAIDGTLPEWQAWAYPCDETHEGDDCKITFCEDAKDCAGSCPVSAHSGVLNELNGSNGQSCYWFSNGCTIGCESCDGTTNHVGHGQQAFLYKGMDAPTVHEKNLSFDPFNVAVGDMVLDERTRHTLNVTHNCETGGIDATICASSLRTANTQAACGSPDDFYYFSPWRAPGAAPVVDSCGSAGGRFPGQGTAPAGAQYEKTMYAEEGDVGSNLPMGESMATWKAGAAVEVGWTVMANHGGGYAYRLAPADAPLTEKTFGEMPLDFVGDAILRWGGDRATELPYDAKAKGWETNVGTVPAGSAWRKNPIPSGLWSREGPQFPTVCQESDECLAGYSNGKGSPQGSCKCSGYSNGGPLLPNLEIVDNVQIPKDLAPGRYVLQWRWDCEESDQIWASCSDVTITN